MQFGAKISPNCIVLGHLLVPFANSKEMFIGIVNLPNFEQLLKGGIEQMSLVSAGFNSQI